MKNIKHKLLVGASLLTIAGASLSLSGAVSADTVSGQTLIDKIATKFNLNRDEVKAVFDEERAAHKAERDQKKSEHLQTLVDDGKITAEQKIAIETKLGELDATREATRDQNLSREEIKAKMDEERAALESWAKEQGIDITLLKPAGDHKGPHGLKGHGPQDTQNDQTQTGDQDTDTNN